MCFTQLEPPIPMAVADKGNGYAFAVIDYGQEFDLLWVVAMDEGGEIWAVPNPKVRMQANWSMGRAKPFQKGGEMPAPQRIAAVAG